LYLRNIFKEVLRNTLAWRKLKITRIGEKDAPFQYLRQILFPNAITLLLDVGANKGQSGRQFREIGYKGRLVSFEPLQEEFKDLSLLAKLDNNWICYNVAIGESKGEEILEVSNSTMSSSFLPMLEDHIRYWPISFPLKKERVPVWPLDSLIDELEIEANSVFLKVDVQGYEGKVLGGAKKVLGLIKAILIEVLFVPLYEGQLPYHEIMATLEAAGLRFIGIYDQEYDPATGFPIFGNALFIRQ
jgi:FkbM family methyltransferase